MYLILMMPDYHSYVCNKMQWQQNRCIEIHWNDKDGYFLQYLLKIHQKLHIIHQQSYCVLTHINWQNRPATANLKLVSYQPIRCPGRYISPSLMYVTLRLGQNSELKNPVFWLECSLLKYNNSKITLVWHKVLCDKI